MCLSVCLSVFSQAVESVWQYSKMSYVIFGFSTFKMYVFLYPIQVYFAVLMNLIIFAFVVHFHASV